MKATFIFVLMTCMILLGCEKTADEIRAGKSAEKRAEKNMAAHERR